MKNDWNNKIAKEYVRHYSKRKVNKELAERIYTTHLLGKNSDLVLHGGGNTSGIDLVPKKNDLKEKT